MKRQLPIHGISCRICIKNYSDPILSIMIYLQINLLSLIIQIAVRVGTVMGGSLGKMTLTADSGRHIADDAVVLSKKTLTTTSDP